MVEGWTIVMKVVRQLKVDVYSTLCCNGVRKRSIYSGNLGKHEEIPDVESSVYAPMKCRDLFVNVAHKRPWMVRSG